MVRLIYYFLHISSYFIQIGTRNFFHIWKIRNSHSTITIAFFNCCQTHDVKLSQEKQRKKFSQQIDSLFEMILRIYVLFPIFGITKNFHSLIRLQKNGYEARFFFRQWFFTRALIHSFFCTHIALCAKNYRILSVHPILQLQSEFHFFSMISIFLAIFRVY